jgi:Holliday junction resolvase RusA-like endonuclease
MKIILPFKTPTINHLYWHRGNIKIMKTEAKELREKIIELINKKIFKHEIEYLVDKELKVRIEIYEDWYNKDLTVKKKDIQNREKFLVDSVFNALDIDDKYVFECSFIKKQCDNDEYSIVFIDEIIK